MNEVISSIIDAEAKADKLVKEATEKSKNILTNSDAQSEQIKNDAISSFKVYRKESINNAILDAEKQYNAKILKGEEETKKIVEEKNILIENIANELVKEITK